jgi:hypothetical protein
MMSPHSAGTLQLWRQRFGYANDQTIRHLPDVAIGVEITDFKTSRLPRGEPKPLDEAYELANPKQQISRKRPDPTPNDPPFAHLDIDIIQETTPGYNGDRYIFHYLCSRINFHILTTARQKLELPADIQYQVEFIKLQWGFEVKVIHIDGETSLGTAFDDWVREKRIKYHESAPQHGRIEGTGGILSSIPRILRIDTRLPENMHPELWRTAAYLANRLPTVRLTTLIKHSWFFTGNENPRKRKMTLVELTQHLSKRSIAINTLESVEPPDTAFFICLNSINRFI